jgi:hypothetical protein
VPALHAVGALIDRLRALAGEAEAAADILDRLVADGAIR